MTAQDLHAWLAAFNAAPAELQQQIAAAVIAAGAEPAGTTIMLFSYTITGDLAYWLILWTYTAMTTWMSLLQHYVTIDADKLRVRCIPSNAFLYTMMQLAVAVSMVYTLVVFQTPNWIYAGVGMIGGYLAPVLWAILHDHVTYVKHQATHTNTVSVPEVRAREWARLVPFMLLGLPTVMLGLLVECMIWLYYRSLVRSGSRPLPL